MRKRQMFDRAYLDLLSRRFVWAPAPGQERAQRPQELLEADAGATASSYFTTSGKELLCGTGFLAMLSRYAGETDTPSWRITTGALRPCALHAPRYPATEVHY